MPVEFISSTNFGPSNGVRYARHVLPLMRRELAQREVTGNAPILNPDSMPEREAQVV